MLSKTRKYEYENAGYETELEEEFEFVEGNKIFCS
jgi:hypothetical protein